MTEQAKIFDDRVCKLGEGPLWHPLRQQLFWFDILGCRLLSRKDGQMFEWAFEEHVSAAGWVDENTLLIASETGLFLFDLVAESRTALVSLEADNPVTRSNDGRADPWGGFWIGTMGKQAEKGAGSIYRYYEGKVVSLVRGLTIPNAICFSPDRRFAFYTDTLTQLIKRQPLDDDGWPIGSSSVFIDLRSENRLPDGAVVDAQGCLWSAQWGSASVARYSTKGVFLDALQVPASQTSCPAFGGETLDTLYVTSAAEGLTSEDGLQGCTFSAHLAMKGVREPRVVVR